MKEPLAQQPLIALLDEWVGAEVAIRVVSSSDDLIAVCQGASGPLLGSEVSGSLLAAARDRR